MLSLQSKAPKRHIVWKKWNDPSTQIKQQLQNHMRTQLLQHLNTNEYQDDDENDSVYEHNFAKQYEMPTPIEVTCELLKFNFWVGHTNFNITKPIVKILDSTDGVETLELVSRYRFRVGIGTAFNEGVVKNNIASSITSYFNHNKINEKTHNFTA